MKTRKSPKPPSLIYLTLGVKIGKRDRHYNKKYILLNI